MFSFFKNQFKIIIVALLVVMVLSLILMQVKNVLDTLALQKEYKDLITSKEFIVGEVKKEKREYVDCEWIESTTDVTEAVDKGEINVDLPEDEKDSNGWDSWFIGGVRVEAKTKTNPSKITPKPAPTKPTTPKTTTPKTNNKTIKGTQKADRQNLIKSPTKSKTIEANQKSNYYFILLPNGQVNKVQNECKDTNFVDYTIRINDNWENPIYKTMKTKANYQEPDWYAQAVEGETAYWVNEYEHIPKAIENFPGIPAGFKQLYPEFYSLVPDRPTLNGYKGDMLLKCKDINSAITPTVDLSINQTLDLANRDLNVIHKKQVNLLIIVCPEEILTMLEFADQMLEGAIEESWKGSEKNQLIFLTFVSQDLTIKSIRTITWAAGEDTMNEQARDNIGKKLDVAYVEDLKEITKNNFVRESFNKKYQDLKEELQTKYKIK